MQELKSTILVVDDEAVSRNMQGFFLHSSEYKIEESKTGKQALRMAYSIKPDLVLLNLELSDIDGTHVVRQIREWSHMPIIASSEQPQEEDIIAVLDAGADDYIAKPLHAGVLMAKVRANLRKAAVKAAGEPELVNGPIRMDLIRHETYVRGRKVTLTPKEYRLLRFLMIHRGQMLTHRQILGELWGASQTGNSQYLRVYIGQLREKLEDVPSCPVLIVTEPGVGYRMEFFETDLAKAA